MGIPQVVIVGRPNVGKSSLFNWLVGKRLAIVEGTAGVTRDRLTYLMCVDNRYFELVDTGGMGVKDSDNLTEDIERQIDIALESASVVLFVVDTRTGLTPLDQDVSKRLRYLDVPILCVANKTDDQSMDNQADEFYRLGRGRVVRVSVQQNRGRDELIDLIMERLPEDDSTEPPVEATMKVAIVGRRNTGKSTFVNTLAQAERMIVSEVAGTTRDSVDVRFELDGKAFVAIDTPGLRRRKSISTDIDFYSSHRAQRGIRRADVVLLFFDATQPISKVDKQLGDYIAAEYRPCVFVVNKWDQLVDKMPTEKWVTYLRDTFRIMWHVPIAFITGQTGKNVKALLNLGQVLYKQSQARVSTADLNKLLQLATDNNPPPLVSNRRPKIYYGTQVGIQPPTIVLFCNEPKLFKTPYRRYLLGMFRDHLPFAEVPIKLYLRRSEEGSGAGSLKAGEDTTDIPPADEDASDFEANIPPDASDDLDDFVEEDL